MSPFQNVQSFLTELGFSYQIVDAAEEILSVTDESCGLKNLILDCQDPVLVLEQFILELDQPNNPEHLRWLLRTNRELVHGAFALDESGKRVMYRDTLAIAHLNLNELQGSIESLELALAEHADRLIALAGH